MKRRALFLGTPLLSKTNKSVVTVVGLDSFGVVKIVLFKVGEKLNDFRVDFHLEIQRL